MKVGILAPSRPLEQGGGSTFEEELFYSLLRLYKESSHELIVFALGGTWKPPAGDDQLKIVRVGGVPWRRLWGAITSIVNRFFSGTLGIPNAFRAEDWLDPILNKHGVQFFLNLTPWSLTKEVP